MLRAHDESERIVRGVTRCLDLAMRWSGTIFRAAAIEFANRRDMLSGVGAKVYGARWTPRGDFPAVYGSFSPQTALLESLGTGSRYGIPPEQRMPLVMVAIDVGLERCLDITCGTIRRLLRVSQTRMLADDWGAMQERSQEALPQAIARISRSLGIQGLIVPSAQLRGERNLVVFADRVSTDDLRIQHVEKLPPS